MTLTSIGPAAPGFPLSGAALSGDRLLLISRNLDPVRVAVVDTGTWTVSTTVTLDRGDGAFATTTAPDGVWLVLFGAQEVGNVFRLGAGAPQLKARLNTLLPWDLTSDGGDTIYGVATNPSLVFSIERGTGHARDLGLASTQAHRPRTCAIVGDRVVFAGAISGTAWIRHTDRDGRDARNAVPSAIATDDLVYCSDATADGRLVVGTAGHLLDTPAIAVLDLDDPSAALVARLPRETLVDTVACVGDQVFATARPSGALYRLDTTSGELYRLAVPVPLSETRELFVHRGRLIGASADGSAWTHDPATGHTSVHSPAAMGLVSRPQRPQSVLADVSTVDVGGSFSVTRHDLTAGTSDTQFVPGEPKAMVDAGGIRYMALYPVAEIWAWPDGRPSPLRLTRLPNDQLRPIDLAYSTQLDALVVSTTDDRARTAIHTVDPVTGRVDTTFNPLGAGQTASGLLVVGSICYVGGSRDAAVGAFALRSGRQLWQIDDALPGGSFVLGLREHDGFLVVSTTRGWLGRISLSSRTVVARRQIGSTAGRLAQHGDALFLATPDQLLRVDPTTLDTTVAAAPLDSQVWGWPPLSVDGDGRAWLISGRDLVHTQLDPVRS